MTGASGIASPWWKHYPHVFLDELQAARRRRFRARFGRWDEDRTADTERLIMTGGIRVKAARPGEEERWHGVAIDIAYPPNYPFDKLDVRPRDQRIRRRRHQLRRSGDLCYMQEEIEQWALGYGFDRVIEGAMKWWQGEVTGHFEDEVPAAELLSYVEPTERIRALLIPDHAMWNTPPDDHGFLSLEWDGQRGGLAIVGVHRRLGGPPLVEVRSTNDKLWTSVRGPTRFTGVEGLWFSLEGEPGPFSNLQELEEVLAKYGGMRSDDFRSVAEQVLNARARTRGWLPIGLNYPGRIPVGAGRADREWLFFCLEWPGMSERLQRARRLRSFFWDRSVTLKGISAHSVRREELLRRVGGLYPTETLQKAHVMVVGTGALGSTVARSLTAAGVGRLTLVEYDTVHPGNVLRHEARMPDVGKSKASTMCQILRETNPHVKVEAIVGTRGEDGAFEQAVLDRREAPTLIIATVALRAVHGQTEEVARRAASPVPVLHAWVTAQAQVLRAFVYRPGRTACVWCSGLHGRDRKEGNDNGYIVEPDVKDQPFFEASCASPAFPGAGNSSALAAHVITEMALDALHDRLPDDESHWVFAGNRIEQLDPDFPVAPLTVARRGFAVHSECPVCSEGVLSTQLNDVDREAYSRALARVRSAA